MKITEITYERNFELQRFIFEKISFKVSIAETDQTPIEQHLQQLKQLTLDNNSLTKPLQPQLSKITGTREVKKNDKITTEELEVL